MIELRGIIVDYPNDKKRVVLVIRDYLTNLYTHVEYHNKNLSKDKVINFLSDKYKIDKSDVIIPLHINFGI